jgi:hypothetical protein
MRDIYSRAEEAVIWLGPSTLHENAHLAFSACEQYAARMHFCIHLLASLGMKDYNRIADESLGMTLRSRPFTGAASDALVEILRQPYWSRLWTIQEMCGESCSTLCGPTVRLTGQFQAVLIMIERCTSLTVRSLDSNIRVFLELRRLYHEEE